MKNSLSSCGVFDETGFGRKSLGFKNRHKPGRKSRAMRRPKYLILPVPQVREADIGTHDAPAPLRNVPHHLVDVRLAAYGVRYGKKASRDFKLSLKLLLRGLYIQK